MNNACYKSSALFKLLIVANSVVHVNAPSIPISITKTFSIFISWSGRKPPKWAWVLECEKIMLLI